ncbi:aspartate kinase [Salisaeta longa]|uniref:aspartate kinase n=1 Tax=Salisaeta longa TaxID=503170 RepID=UPI0003B422B1|nr:aspartate kinase [Salisaeta longa]
MSSAASKPLVVLKFGGSSVGTPAHFRNVIDTVTWTAESARVVTVVSALSMVTRQLSNALENFVARPDDPAGRAMVQELLDALRERHTTHAEALLSSDAQEAYGARLDDQLAELRDTFGRIAAEGFSPAGRDAVLSTGEQLAVPMVTLALRDRGHVAPFCDATALLHTDASFGAAAVDRDATAEAVRRWYAGLASHALPVLAGYIGRAPDGRTTTLGFEGSDYTASLLAALLNATCLTRFTDVDGLYTADPGTNPDVERLERLSMEQAFAMTESGHLGMHPKTLRPLAEAGVPMQVRSIRNPRAAGTLIVPKGVEEVHPLPPIEAA